MLSRHVYALCNDRTSQLPYKPLTDQRDVPPLCRFSWSMERQVLPVANDALGNRGDSYWSRSHSIRHECNYDLLTGLNAQFRKAVHTSRKNPIGSCRIEGTNGARKLQRISVATR